MTSVIERLYNEAKELTPKKLFYGDYSEDMYDLFDGELAHKLKNKNYPEMPNMVRLANWRFELFSIVDLDNADEEELGRIASEAIGMGEYDLCKHCIDEQVDETEHFLDELKAALENYLKIIRGENLWCGR